VNTLKHVGVLGMKWGHRKQQERESSSSDREVVLGKGETLHHVTSNPNLKLSPDILYTSFTKKDVLTYRSHYADQVRAMRDVSKVLDYNMVATEKLVSPTKRKRIDELIALHKEDPAILTKLAETNLDCGLILQTAKALGFRSIKGDAERYRKQLTSNNPEDQEKAFRDFVKVLPLSKPMRKKYFDRLEKQGFNSMYDDNDMLSGFSQKPLIVFKPNKTLKIKGSVTDDEEATDRVYAELEKLIEETK
jgi:hypothetical protein